MNFTRPRIVDPDFKDGAAVAGAREGGAGQQEVRHQGRHSGPRHGRRLPEHQPAADEPPARAAGTSSSASSRSGPPGPARPQRSPSWQRRRRTCRWPPAPIRLPSSPPCSTPPRWCTRTPTSCRHGSPTDRSVGPCSARSVDAAGRPLFPFLGATNAIGPSSLGDFNLGPLGLQQIVTPGISTTDIFIGNGSAFEAYAYAFPILEAIEPALLGRQVAVAEAMCFYRPTTKEAGPGDVPPAEGKTERSDRRLVARGLGARRCPRYRCRSPHPGRQHDHDRATASGTAARCSPTTTRACRRTTGLAAEVRGRTTVISRPRH